MNRLAFDSTKQVIDQWEQIYFCEPILDSFQTLIDRTHMYLQIISEYKLKVRGELRLTSQNSLCTEQNQNDDEEIAENLKHIQSDNPDALIKRIQSWTNNIKLHQKKIKMQRKTTYVGSENQSNKNTSNMISQEIISKSENIKLKICQTHLQTITLQSLKFYHTFLHQDFKIIQHFLNMKFGQLYQKFDKIEVYFIRIDPTSPEFQKLRIIFQNLYIEAEYLKKFIHKNKSIFDNHSHQKQFSSQYQEINHIREEFITHLNSFNSQIEEIKLKIRIMYVTFIKRSSKKIYSHEKLQKKISDEIEVNSNEYEQNSENISFGNGMAIAFLLFAMIGIVIFREVNLSQLELNPNYLVDFRVWRGASYLIYFNWIIGVILFLFTKFKINYRMILIEEDAFLPKYQSFFLSASVLSAIYLTLFLVYLLHKVKMIPGFDFFEWLAYVMWIINILFLINPFKFLNYDGRRYFLKMLGKISISIFRPMTVKITFCSIIIGSFVQPFGDFAFTICEAVYQQSRDCSKQTKIATFVFTLIFLSYRVIQSIRSHRQFGDRCYSRPLIGMTGALFNMNTVISSYIYNLYLTQKHLKYWIVCAAFSTLASIQTDLRADWGLVGFDQEDWILRKFKFFPRTTYFIVAALDSVLLIGWILTISNNTANDLGINLVYFLMILSYVQIARRGMWIFMRIEDWHSLNRGNLRALLDDSHIYKELSGVEGPQVFQLKIDKQLDVVMAREHIQLESYKKSKSTQKGTDTEKDYSTVKLKVDRFQSSKSLKDAMEPKKGIKLSDIQRMITNKKLIKESLSELVSELQKYLDVIHSIYKDLDWEDDF